MTREDEVLVRVLLGGKHLDEPSLEKAKKLQREKHPRRELGDVLLQYGLIDKEKLAVALRLAKMATRTPTGRPKRGEVAKELAKAEVEAAKSEPKNGDPVPPTTEPEGLPVGADAPPRNGAFGAGGPTAAAPPATATEDPTAADTHDVSTLPTPLMTPKVEAPEVRVKRFQDRTRFGRYDVVEKIARGGMGVVYKVRHPGLDRLFALKVLAQGEDADEEVLERFRREAKTAARLDHPSIVRVHDAGTEDGFPYIVMDLVEGDSVAKVLKEEGVSPRKATLIARSIARALAHAHEKGIVHRDVKPDNVLIERATGEARLSDFGIVKDLRGGDADAKLTKTGLTLGSPCYMSPEQAAGRHKDVGPVSDVYSLGATLYEMLAGVPPFDGESIHSIMTKVVHDDPVPPRKKNAAIHPELEAVCMKALEKEPERRYGSAQAFAEDLERHLDGKPVLARPPGIGSKVVRAVRRHRAPAILALVLVALVAYVAFDAMRVQRRERLEKLARLEEGLDAAEQELERAAGPELTELEARRCYRDALRGFDRVLETAPTNARARAGKARAVLALADRLLERREVGFAEFVLDQAEGLVDAAAIDSRRDLARKSEWVQRAETAELKGDLDEALRLLREGLRSLRDAGLSGELLEAKIKELTRLVAERKRDEESRNLVETGERQETAGDLAVALETFRRALEITPEQPSLVARIQIIEGRVRRGVEEAIDQAAAEAERAKAARPPGGITRPDLSNQLEQGAALEKAARDKAAKGEWGPALDMAKRAQACFRIALDVANALAAREDAIAARETASKQPSAAFVDNELRRGRVHEDKGEAKLAAGEYALARADFVEAATYYRLASNAGEIKQAVATAREAARLARVRAQGELPQAITLRVVREAETSEREAKAAETANDLGKARELWGQAAGLWSQAEQRARPARDALTARERALGRKVEAEAELASEYDKDDDQSARTAFDDGDQALKREDFSGAQDRYGKAEYFWKQAAAKSAPISRPKRRIEALRRAAEEARIRARAAEKAYTKRFEDAEGLMRTAQKHERDKYWKGAEDYYARARNIFDSLASGE